MFSHPHYRRSVGDGLSVAGHGGTAMSGAALANWDNEGGALIRDVPGAVLAPARARLSPITRQARDTPAGCRKRALADLDRAAAEAPGRPGWLYEHSAATWLQRAEMLERRDAELRARRAGAEAV
jgi:hypothetical protein